MTNVLLIIFIISLLYVAIANRIITYVRVLALQGFILLVLLFFSCRKYRHGTLFLSCLKLLFLKQWLFRCF